MFTKPLRFIGLLEWQYRAIEIRTHLAPIGGLVFDLFGKMNRVDGLGSLNVWLVECSNVSAASCSPPTPRALNPRSSNKRSSQNPGRHGRRNGFESGTAEGVEYEPPKVANRDVEDSGVWGGVFSSQQGGPGVIPADIFFRNLCVNWCIFECKSLMKLTGQIKTCLYYNVGAFELDDSSWLIFSPICDGVEL